LDISNNLWQPGWCPISDLEVTQIMKYLKQKRIESTKIVESAKQEIEMLEDIGKDSEDSLAKLEDRVGYLLKNYVLNETDETERKETDTQIKYKLARGSIVIKKSTFQPVEPDDKNELMKLFPKFIKKEPKFMWGDFKKTLSIEDGKVKTVTGDDIASIVLAIEKPSTVQIKLD